MDKKILFLGGGQMAEGIIAGILDKKVFAPQDVTVHDVVEERLLYLKKTYGIIPAEDVMNTIRQTDIIFLAIRPQDIANACQGMEDALEKNNTALIISIVAGTTLSTLGTYTGYDKKIVRVMPNTLIKSNNGFSAACINEHIDGQDKDMITEILKTLGQVMFLDETMFDLFTAYSCVGPMYIYMLMHALIEAGVRTGFSREDAYAITIKNTLGAAQMLEKSGEHPLQKIDTMTSPGGITIEALASLEEAGFVGMIMKSVKASVDKTLSLK